MDGAAWHSGDEICTSQAWVAKLSWKLSRAGFGERFWSSSAGTQGCVGSCTCLHHLVLGDGFWRVCAQDEWGAELSLDTGVGLRVSSTSVIALGEQICGCSFSLPMLVRAGSPHPHFRAPKQQWKASALTTLSPSDPLQHQITPCQADVWL